VTLLGNHYRQGASPARNMLGGAHIGSMDRQLAYLPGQVRGLWVGEAFAEDVERQSMPPGYRHPAAWMMAPDSGGMTSGGGNAIELSASLALAAGRGVSGQASITLVASGLASLIVSASGQASITITGTGAMAGVLAAAGLATITLDASGAASATATLSGQALLSLVGSGALDGIGHMSGTSTTDSPLSAQSLATAVWSALAASNNAAGTMGEKLNDAGSAANPWTEDLSGPQTAGTAGYLLKIATQILRNKQITDPATGVMTVFDDDGSVLFTANLYQDAAGSQPYVGNGVDRRERLS
jgi:hypothetical protein